MRRSFAIVLVLAACGAAMPRAATDARAGWDAWRAERHEELAGENGWLALIGLFWLEPGTHTIGSAGDRELILPRGPERLGTVRVDGRDVRFAPEDGAETALAIDGDALAVGELRLLAIERAGRIALRVRDVSSPARATLGEIPVYDYDPSMRVRARVHACDPPGRVLSLVNVLGMPADEPCAGSIEALVGGAAIALVATAAGDAPEDGYFVMLRDATSDAEETYPGGRYLDVPAADASGETWLDLNRLYTPPCGYTSLATCPLPPVENVLPFPIRAGERYIRHEDPSISER
jgi:uncharacterized protein (DUF1684 family)